MTFTPCSTKHRSCSPAHAELVSDYRRERERQETVLEITLSYQGDREHWKAMGGKLIDFKTWLKANRGVRAAVERMTA